MRIWNLFLAAALMLTVGFGAGYYAKTVVYSNAQNEQIQVRNNAAKNNAETPTPSPQRSSTPEPSVPDANVSAPGEAYIQNGGDEEQKGYLLKEYYGNIAVYKIYAGARQMLVDIVDVGVESLPKSDRDMLAMGISVENEEEMLQLIEDYTS